MDAGPLQIGGLTSMTTIDFPGRLAAVVFCQGCPWRCGYCQNAHLIPREAQTPVDWGEVLAFLERRRGLLDGVVFSGGEPTLQKGLPDAMRTVRAMGYEIGLHTAGPYPGRLAQVLPLVDWVGFDIKAPADDYEAVTGVPESATKALESASLLLESGVSYEFRTTVHPELLDTDSLRGLARDLAGMGVESYVLQECIYSHCLDESLRPPARTVSIPEALRTDLGRLFPQFSVRTAA
jgi:pyruvate formate lyase activating enzyme